MHRLLKTPADDLVCVNVFENGIGEAGHDVAARARKGIEKRRRSRLAKLNAMCFVDWKTRIVEAHKSRCGVLGI
jgi:hypothetical protein